MSKLAAGSTKSSIFHLIPHVGLHFQNHNGKYYPINHNYMHSLWALLILIAVCSYFAQRQWASMFTSDILKALLKLPGHKDLSLVRKAQELCAYERLMKLPIPSKGSERKFKSNHDCLVQLFKGSPMLGTIDILVGDDNAHNHILDYYSNQLIYLLLAAQKDAYKMTKLKIKRKLIFYSIYSFIMTLMQFILPLMFIGDKYALYGWHYFKAWYDYTTNQFWNQLFHLNAAAAGVNGGGGGWQPPQPVNSIDYELSGKIWPTSTMCEYLQYGYQVNQKLERFTTQCTVPINEICSKIFFIIWWFVAINIVIEFISLCSLLICSINFVTIETTFGFRYWPKAKEEAKGIARFRNNHAVALNEQLKNNTLKMNFDGFVECKEDPNMYYLLLLLYMRMNNSRRKTEQILRMTGKALNRYLESLNKLEELKSDIEKDSFRDAVDNLPAVISAVDGDHGKK